MAGKDRQEEKKFQKESEETGQAGKPKAEAGPEAKKEQVISLKKEEYKKLIEAAELVEDFKDKYLRAQAELDNTRKRLIKEKEEYVKFANEDILSDILYVVDNFDRALQHMSSAEKVESILEGVKMIQKQFHLLLEQKGVIKIEAAGKKFDPALHEAVERVETEEDKDGVIIEEVQAGYLLNGRLLRPAVVKVGKKKTAEGDISSN